MASYNYEQIGDSERVIRVLILSAGTQEDPLRGNIEICSLDKAKPYEALSYCWGSPIMNALIDCSRGSIRITKTLEHALKVLRHQDTTRRLWIDQICINQIDNAERSSQVRLMYDIYSLAQRTVVWLGDDEHELGPVVRNFRLTDAQFKAEESDGELIANHESRWFPTDEILRRCPLPDRSSEAWPAFNALLESVYFTRVWTLQEVLSSREAVILWGTTELPWAKLRGAYHWAILNHCMVKDLRQDIHSPALKRVKFLELEISWFRGMRFQSLADLVIICREGFEATNPRDQIYAFTSLASDGRDFEINYDKSEAEVFTDFSRCYLRSGDLTMLNLAGL
ncbi:heterokaryon incompatibility protein-domain-containing protein, partial [Diaporthe sp. PMI_573]